MATEKESNKETTFNKAVQAVARRIVSESDELSSVALFPKPSQENLDPSSSDFDAEAWTKAFYRLRKQQLRGAEPTAIGVAFKGLDAYGFRGGTHVQSTVSSVFLRIADFAKRLANPSRAQRIQILQDLEGVVNAGETVAVLGPPGSGCSTFLKIISGNTDGFHVSKEPSSLNYQGIRPEQMKSVFRGEAIYTSEVDEHTPQLSVGDTLYFAARARTPDIIPEGTSRRRYAEHLRDVTMSIFGIANVKRTSVGDDVIRGISGGERKRVSIAEAALSYAPLQCWDNSTRGLDSSNAITFCKSLRTQADVLGTTSFVSIYQTPQSAYDTFDKVLLLYKGRQIYFGKATEAKAYFENLGFTCPQRQTTADFLTSMTSPSERLISPGCESKAPRSPEEFAAAWRNSAARAALLAEHDQYAEAHPFDGQDAENCSAARVILKSKHQRRSSPFTISYLQQIRLNVWRGFVLLRTDPSLPVALLISYLIEALVTASIFYNLPQTTGSFRQRSILVFYVLLVNSFSSALEILTLYAKRKVVEKHARYALYRSSAEALASLVVDLPHKIVNAIILNSILYFMSNMRREPGPFFFFLLINFTLIMVMSMLFRLIGSITKSIEQALAPTATSLLCLVMYAGYTIPQDYMPAWLGWVRYGNPMFYGLESLTVNEFAGREFECSTFVPQGPGYDDVIAAAGTRACSVPGAVPGRNTVSGAAYVSEAFGFEVAHKWRNFGILIALGLAYLALHLLAIEFISSERSKGEVLVFGRAGKSSNNGTTVRDEEAGLDEHASDHRNTASTGEVLANVDRQTSIFHWRNVSYGLQIKGEQRQILDQIDGWIKPGTLTALMGASGAGKTTLLDVLSQRVTIGIVTGEILVNGSSRSKSFQQETGYAHQQDLHVPTATVREALTFSALLRQPSHYTQAEKMEYVDSVLRLLEMEEYANAVIGVPGEGLNVEQRKRLTIGVELAARPRLLLFLDEPTSGLDSQTSWSICDLMEKLAKNGQAVLCTIHQPSAMLFQRFDRLLLLTEGKTAYFGEIGRDASTVLDYFYRNGAPNCPIGLNAAEYMLDTVISSSSSSNSSKSPGGEPIDWAEIWKTSPEYQSIQSELDVMGGEMRKLTMIVPLQALDDHDQFSHEKRAASWQTQLFQVTKRLFQSYWRNPIYIYYKLALGIGATLVISLSYINVQNTQRGTLNQVYGVFIFLAIFPQVVDQIMHNFLTQRGIFEARERPAKVYSWKIFMISNIFVEICWNSIMALICFFCWYYPIGLYHNAEWTGQVNSRGVTTLFQVWTYFLFISTFAHMMIAGLENADVASGIVNLFMILMYCFCGILGTPDQLPRFWIFMYRVNPFTYIVESFLGTTLASAPMHCEPQELISFTAPAGQTCGQYMESYISRMGGFLQNSSAIDCRFCPIANTSDFLSSLWISFDHRWRNFGFAWIYILFNAAVALFLYWLVRVPKAKKG